MVFLEIVMSMYSKDKSAVKINNKMLVERRQTSYQSKFKSVFTQEDLENLPSLPQVFPNISQLHFDTVGIAKLLSNLDVKKAAGSDQIPCWVLKTGAQEIAPFLQRFSSLSLQIGDFPRDWKKANIHAILETGDRSLASNYRPISLTFVSCKIMKNIIFSHIMSHLEEFKVLSDIQHDFRKSHSCKTQLLITLEDLATDLDHGKQSDIILLDFAKAFDTVPHQRLLLKLNHYGVQGTINKWIQAWLCYREQSVLVEGEKSAPVSVMSVVPQGTVLGPLMFLIYINDIGVNIKSHIRLFADDTLLYATVSSKDDANTLQRDLDSLALVVQKLDSAIHQINRYPVDKYYEN